MLINIAILKMLIKLNASRHALFAAVIALAALPVVAQSPASRPAPEEFKVPAIIAAGREAVLSAQMPGRISAVHVGIGDRFAAGAVLVEFDCAEKQALLAAAAAEGLGARETHLAKLRLQGLGAAGELEVMVAAAAAEKARSQVRLIEAQMLYCKVLAPYAGAVAAVRVKAAESVNLGQPLLEIASDGSAKAQINVPASWGAWLRIGTSVSVKTPDGKTYAARVAKMSSRIDGASQSLEIEAHFVGAGSRRLTPGMAASAEFPVRR
jgi:RND family efflux transporter MFP subunit